MNPALLSPSSFTDSMPSITSWGTLIVVICDFAFLYTDIVNHQFVMCISLYTKVRYKNTCNVYHHNIMYISHYGRYVSHNDRFIKTTKPGSARTLTGLLTKPLNEVTIMAGTQHTPRLAHTQTAFVWRFIALSTAQPRVIHIEATSEQEARQQSPAGCVMVFAARIRQEVRHVQ
ncbi:host cell division inhibitor Icd-like protein [Escherichia coli]